MAGSVWAGVAVSLFFVQASVMLTALVMSSALTAARPLSGAAAVETALVAEVVGAVGSILAIVTIVVVLVTVGSAVSARHQQIALWLLMGATPGQVVRMVLVQAVVVTVLVALPAAAVAVVVIDPAMTLVA